MVVGFSLLGCCGLGLFDRYAGSSATVTIRNGAQTKTQIYDTRAEMEREAPGYNTFLLASGVIAIGLASVMILGSLGLLLCHAWGWWLSAAWGVLELGYQVGTAAYLWLVAMPAANRVVKVVPHDEAGLCNGLVNGNTLMHFGWAIFASGFWLYPAIVLLMLILPPVRRACFSGGKDEEETRRRRLRKDYDEDDEY
jgi:hypothetical protein